MNEFEIIRTYFQTLTGNRKDVILGPGDDCALLKVPPDQLLAVSIDTLISGIHFPLDLAAYEIGYKSLAVNLSDLAAMGAMPAWFSCALTLNENNPEWLKNFSQGLKDIAQRYQVSLIGGDLTQGKILSITIQVHGFVPENAALKRHTAKIGDSIYVSGKLGYSVLKKYYHCPEPQIELGCLLRGKATSAIDISDGLLADLSHLLNASKVGAHIYLDQIPLVHPDGLFSGDDYELCFTGPSNLSVPGHNIFCIGKITLDKALKIYFSENDKRLYTPAHMGYKHF